MSAPRRLLPPKVHISRGRYFWVDKNKWHPLSRVSEGLRELYRRYATISGEQHGTLAGIFAQYAEGPMQELAPSTRKTYEYFLFGILHHHFGHLLPREVQPGHIAQYLEMRKEAGAAVAGNRERAALSSAFEFAMRKGWANSNPCRGVRRNTERGSRALIESASLVAGIERAPPHVARLLKFGYLTGVRRCDLIALRVSAIRPEGIVFDESKTKKPRVIEWTDRLRELVREILEARHAINIRVQRRGSSEPGRVDHDRLFTNRFGKPLTAWGVQSAMRRLKVDWTFRQLRPKAQTDAGDRNVLGHSGQMRARYTRREKLKPVW